MATYSEALTAILRETGVSNGGVQVHRLSELRGVACVESATGELVARAAFDWGTTPPGLRGQSVLRTLEYVRGARA